MHPCRNLGTCYGAGQGEVAQFRGTPDFLRLSEYLESQTSPFLTISPSFREQQPPSQLGGPQPSSSPKPSSIDCRIHTTPTCRRTRRRPRSSERQATGRQHDSGAHGEPSMKWCKTAATSSPRTKSRSVSKTSSGNTASQEKALSSKLPSSPSTPNPPTNTPPAARG